MMLFHNEWFVTKICFYQSGSTVYQLSSSLKLHLGQKDNEGVMTTVLEQLDIEYATQSQRKSCLNDSPPRNRVTPVIPVVSQISVQALLTVWSW